MGNLLKGVTFVPPATHHVALFKTLPNLDGSGGSEVATTSGGNSTGYSRQPMSVTGGDWIGPQGASLVYTNIRNIQFQKPLADWGTIVGICLFDSATGGNLLWRGTGMSKEVTAADAGPMINAGQLEIHVATC